MKNIDELFNNITTLYKQKLFGKYLQIIFKNKMFNISKDIIFILKDDYSFLSLLMLLNVKRYIIKDLKITILNLSSYSKKEISSYLTSDIKYIKLSLKEYTFIKIKKALTSSKIKIKGSAFIFNDSFDDEIAYILNSILNKGKLISLNPVERKSNYFIFRPNILIKERDIISIMNKYDLNYSVFSSFSFEKENLNDLNKTKEVISYLRKSTSQAEMNIYDALNNVILDKVISYKKNSKEYDFFTIYKSLD